MRQRTSFRSDSRAIEGLPIRLVIALVVGVAALGIMMNMLGGLGDIGSTQVELEIEDGYEIVEEGSTDTFSVWVYTEDGKPVESGEVLLTAESARVDDSPVRSDIGGCTTCDDHEAEFDLGNVDPTLRTGQDTGELALTIVPTNDDYEDSDTDHTITVVDS